MKTFVILILMMIILLSDKSYSQIGQFDSATVLVSSINYDYKNPSFYKLSNSINYFIRDCLLSYERWSNPNSSDIAARIMTYNALSPEIILSDSGYISKNPSAGYFEYLPQNNEGIVSYQTNKNGNWDIYYSKYNGTSWSIPIQLTDSSADETYPFVYVYRNSNINNHIVIFLRNSDIIANNFFNGSWLEKLILPLI